MTMTDPQPSFIPYADSKPQGAADFYFAINATFSFILRHMGMDGLRKYWTGLGTDYYAPVARQWQRDGLAGVVGYWRAFFQAEPGADVEVLQEAGHVELNVKTCPAISHLRKAGRQIVACFCQHCYYVSEAIAEQADMTVRVDGGNGSCRQRFFLRNCNEPTQDIDAIRVVS